MQFHTPRVRIVLQLSRIFSVSSVLLMAACTGSDGPNTQAARGFNDATTVTSSEQPTQTSCSPAQLISDGGYTSCNLQWLGRLPLTGTTIGGKLVGKTYYVTNFLSGFYSFDASQPENPRRISNLFVDIGRIQDGTNISTVENEDTATNGKIAILSRTPMQDAVVIDNSNPADMRILGTAPGGQGHTMTCLNNCQWVYASTTGTIIDLRNPTRPVVLKNKWTDVTGGVTAHDVTEVRPGLVVTSSNPPFILDTTDPAHPKRLLTLPQVPHKEPPAGPGPQQEGPVGHNNLWPRNGNDRFFLSLTEALNVGRCENYPVDGRSLYVYDTTGWTKTGKFNLAGRYTLATGQLGLVSPNNPDGIDINGNPTTLELGLQGCSAHWFDTHPAFNDGGMVAMASFSHGMRLLRVDGTGAVKQIGYFVPKGVASTVAVHWISDRVLYVLDFLNGYLDVIKYNGPV